MITPALFVTSVPCQLASAHTACSRLPQLQLTHGSCALTDCLTVNRLIGLQGVLSSYEGFRAYGELQVIQIQAVCGPVGNTTTLAAPPSPPGAGGQRQPPGSDHQDPCTGGACGTLRPPGVTSDAGSTDMPPAAGSGEKQSQVVGAAIGSVLGFVACAVLAGVLWVVMARRQRALDSEAGLTGKDLEGMPSTSTVACGVTTAGKGGSTQVSPGTTDASVLDTAAEQIAEVPEAANILLSILSGHPCRPTAGDAGQAVTPFDQAGANREASHTQAGQQTPAHRSSSLLPPPPLPHALSAPQRGMHEGVTLAQHSVQPTRGVLQPQICADIITDISLDWGQLPPSGSADVVTGQGQAIFSGSSSTVTVDPRQLLGTGAYAWVYQGRLGDQGVPVAVKLLPHATNVANDMQQQQVEQPREQHQEQHYQLSLALQREAALLSTLSHPGIVRVVGVTPGVAGSQPWSHTQMAAWTSVQLLAPGAVGGQATGSSSETVGQPPYAVVFELVQGGTLAAAIHTGQEISAPNPALHNCDQSSLSGVPDAAQQEPLSATNLLPLPAVLQIGAAVAEALAHLATRGLVHKGGRGTWFAYSASLHACGCLQLASPHCPALPVQTSSLTTFSCQANRGARSVQQQAQHTHPQVYPRPVPSLQTLDLPHPVQLCLLCPTPSPCAQPQAPLSLLLTHICQGPVRRQAQRHHCPLQLSAQDPTLQELLVTPTTLPAVRQTPLHLLLHSQGVVQAQLPMPPLRSLTLPWGP
jgi:hypothetical protein